jgi:hypothetical protein
MSILLTLTLLGLFLAGGATVASCLIPELTIAGIWGLPVLGFALLMGVMFRIGTKYDPREPELADDQPYFWKIFTGGSMVLVFAVANTFDFTLYQASRSPIFVIVYMDFIYFSLLLGSIWSDYQWVIHQSLDKSYSVLSSLRSFTLLVSSIFLNIAYLREIGWLLSIMKPIMIFLAYTSCVYFAAINSGIRRSQISRSPNTFIVECLTVQRPLEVLVFLTKVDQEQEQQAPPNTHFNHLEIETSVNV